MAPKREPEKKGSAVAIVLSVVIAAIFGLTYTTRKSALIDGIGPMTFLWVSSLTGSALLALSGLLRSSFRGQRLDRYSLGVSVATGLTNQVIGGVLYLVALTLEKASTLSVVTSAVIPFGFLLAIPLLRERPTRKAAIGLIIIFIGVIMATL